MHSLNTEYYLENRPRKFCPLILYPHSGINLNWQTLIVSLSTKRPKSKENARQLVDISLFHNHLQHQVWLRIFCFSMMYWWRHSGKKRHYFLDKDLSLIFPQKYSFRVPPPYTLLWLQLILHINTIFLEHQLIYVNPEQMSKKNNFFGYTRTENCWQALFQALCWNRLIHYCFFSQC